VEEIEDIGSEEGLWGAYFSSKYITLREVKKGIEGGFFFFFWVVVLRGFI